MFFHFNLLCQKLAYFCFANTTQQRFSFLIVIALCIVCLLHFAVCCLGHIALCSLEVYSFFLFSFVSFAVFLWQSTLFRKVCLFQQPFSYLFYIVFCPLPLSFAFGTFRPLPFEILHISLLSFCPLLPLFVFLCVGFTFCVTFDGNLLQKFVTRQKV